VLPEPGVPEDELLLAKSGHGELNSLAVALVMENQSRDISDEAGLVGGAIHIEHRDRLRELADQNPTGLNVLGVNEVGGRSTVNEPIERKLHSIVSRLNLQREVKGISTGRHGNRIALRKFMLPSGLMGRAGDRVSQ
jgi:hypothetical protein